MEQYPQIPPANSTDPADFVLLPFLDEDQPKDLLILGWQCVQDGVNMALLFLSPEFALGILAGASQFETLGWKRR